MRVYICMNRGCDTVWYEIEAEIKSTGAVLYTNICDSTAINWRYMHCHVLHSGAIMGHVDRLITGFEGDATHLLVVDVYIITGRHT